MNKQTLFINETDNFVNAPESVAVWERQSNFRESNPWEGYKLVCAGHKTTEIHFLFFGLLIHSFKSY